MVNNKEGRLRHLLRLTEVGSLPTQVDAHHQDLSQSIVHLGSPWSDIIRRLKVNRQLLSTELPMCSLWADIIMISIKSGQLLSTELSTASVGSPRAAPGLPGAAAHV